MRLVSLRSPRGPRLGQLSSELSLRGVSHLINAPLLTGCIEVDAMHPERGGARRASISLVTSFNSPTVVFLSNLTGKGWYRYCARHLESGEWIQVTAC
jgi:hypothetical protein